MLYFITNCSCIHMLPFALYLCVTVCTCICIIDCYYLYLYYRETRKQTREGKDRKEASKRAQKKSTEREEKGAQKRRERGTKEREMYYKIQNIIMNCNFLNYNCI